MELERLAVDANGAGTMIGVSERLVRSLVQKNILRSRKIGRRRVILISDIKKFLGADHPTRGDKNKCSR